MYLTSGAKVSTRRSRSLRSPLLLYCCQSASVSSADMRRAVAVFMSDGSPSEEGTGTAAPLGHRDTAPQGRRTDLGQMSRASTPQKWGPPDLPLSTRGSCRSRRTMALRLSKPQSTSSRPGAGTSELPARAQVLLATGDLAGYRALFAQAAEETDVHLRYAARRDLLQAGLSAPHTSVAQLANVFLAVATEGLALLAENPREPVLLNSVGIAFYEVGAYAGAKALFEAAQRLDPQLPHVAGNLREIARRRREGSTPRL